MPRAAFLFTAFLLLAAPPAAAHGITLGAVIGVGILAAIGFSLVLVLAASVIYGPFYYYDRKYGREPKLTPKQHRRRFIGVMLFICVFCYLWYRLPWLLETLVQP